MSLVRNPAVAGAFYADVPEALRADVRRHLDAAGALDGPVPKAIIAPHAGFMYSGPVAASAYARLRPAGAAIRRVVLLGPCHRVAVRGLAASGADAWRTPLGDVPLDASLRDDLVRRFQQVAVSDLAHQAEHSLEVHLPFLQEVLDDFILLPLVVGDASGDAVADVLAAAWGGPETLVVVSSDLSHYLDHAAARRSDQAARRAIEALDPDGLDRDQACGRVPVRGLLTLARREGLSVTTLDLRNSGDTAGPKDRVVGYGAWAFFEPGPAAARTDFEMTTRALLDAHGATLLRLAARAIRARLDGAAEPRVDLADLAPPLRANGASFVTLKRDGRLRGCIGTVAAHRPLAVDVAGNAVAAAFRDPRFEPLTAPELVGLDLSLSVLGSPRPMDFADEDDLLTQLRPGTDGLIITDAGRRALFLPAVWRDLPDPRRFLTHLKRKAGLSSDHWSDRVRAERFAATELAAADLGDPAAIWAEGETV